MSTTIGTSVGEWNTSSKVYPNSEYLNARGRGSTRDYTSGKPFYKSGLHFRTVFSQLGVSYKEYGKRKKVVNKYVEQGLTVPQINNFYEKFKLRGGGSLEQFDSFIADQRLIAEAQAREEAELLARLKEEEKKKAISDSNLFPPSVDNPTGGVSGGSTTTSGSNTTSGSTNVPDSAFDTPKKSNYLLYGAIGLVVVVGAIILIRRR